MSGLDPNCSGTGLAGEPAALSPGQRLFTFAVGMMAAVRVRSCEVEAVVADFLARHPSLSKPPGVQLPAATGLVGIPSGGGSGFDEQSLVLRRRQTRLIQELEALDEHGLDAHAREMMRADIVERYRHLSELIAAGTTRVPTGAAVPVPEPGRDLLAPPPLTYDAQRAVFEACSLRVSYLHTSRRVTATALSAAGTVIETYTL